MYKTITSTLVAGQSTSPPVTVPGRLVAVVFSTDTACNAVPLMVTPHGNASIFNLNTQVFATMNANFTAYITMPLNTVAGNTDYLMQVNAVQVADRPVVYVYEDMPYV